MLKRRWRACGHDYEASTVYTRPTPRYWRGEIHSHGSPLSSPGCSDARAAPMYACTEKGRGDGPHRFTHLLRRCIIRPYTYSVHTRASRQYVHDKLVLHAAITQYENVTDFLRNRRPHDARRHRTQLYDHDLGSTAVLHHLIMRRRSIAMRCASPRPLHVMILPAAVMRMGHRPSLAACPSGAGTLQAQAPPPKGEGGALLKQCSTPRRTRLWNFYR